LIPEFSLYARIAHCAEGEIQPATDRPLPKSPAESAKCVKLLPGFELAIVAAEPLVREPTGICFDERGRLFVCEIHGYNLDGYLDIVELNKTGKLDREVRRVRHATPESQAAAKLETYGTVRMLTDTDGDGRMDKSVVWADRLPPCYGVIAARGGVIVICAPDIVFLADRDGDGTAEVREMLFTGFARELIERGINSPRACVDNWIYVAAGGGGGQISGPKLAQRVEIGHSDFRFKSDGTSIEPVTGRESMFGLTMNDFGDRFHTIVTQVVPLAHQYLVRNPFIPSPPGDLGLNSYREIFPISQPDPWRLARAGDPAWVKFYGATETKPNGFFTATSGQMIYRADSFPEQFRGNYFVCDPANNLVHRCLLERDGLIYSARRAPGEERSEFLASTDQWFRPMSLSVGPDGAIYIVDMYREIVEDFSAIPRFLQQQYAESLIAGKDHGRIWRLTYTRQDTETRPELPPRPATPSLPLRAGVPELVTLLAHPNHWWRETAQRLLVERGDKASREQLVELERQGSTPQARLHALYTLDGQGFLQSGDVRPALVDASYGVRLHALQLAERWFDSDRALLEQALTLVNDDEPRVRLQAALSLGESRDPRALDALARFAVQHGGERWSAAAIVSSASNTADALLEKLLVEKPGNTQVMALLGPLAETVGSRRDDSQIGRVLLRTAELAGDGSAATKLELLDGLIRGLARGKPSLLRNADAPRAIEMLFSSADLEVQKRTLQLVGPLKLNESPAMQRAWDVSGTIALDSEQSLPARLNAVSILSAGPWPRLERLRVLLDARQPTELQLSVVSAVARSDHPGAAKALLANWSGLLPKVQESITDALFARQDRLPMLLDALEQGSVPANSLGALRREQLASHGNGAIRTRARKLLAASVSDDRAAVIRKYEPALALPRDSRHGAAVFEKTCSRCHKLGGQGFEVGPDLLAARTRPDATLLLDILDPSGTLTHGYTVYIVATTDGRIHTGLLAGDSATSVTLRNAAEPDKTAVAGKAAVVETTILRKDIETMQASSKSLMPDGLEKDFTPQDIADLIGFLRQSLGQVVPASLVLFDDEQSFLDALADDGGAVASLSKTDKHSGDAAMRLTAGQRSFARIKGWRFRIVEHPAATKPGEPEQFRYLRFAWKSAGATGLMYEFADNGNWPPANKPLRRYYSGKNSMPWKATEISPDVPTDWTVVTVDLWKDFGEFTLSGIGPVAMNGDGLFDRIELLRTLDVPANSREPAK